MRLLRPVIAAAALLVGVQAQATSYVFHIYSPGIRAVANASPPSTTYATLNPSDMGSSAALWNGQTSARWALVYEALLASLRGSGISK
jgi:hypothetical protein